MTLGPGRPYDRAGAERGPAADAGRDVADGPMEGTSEDLVAELLTRCQEEPIHTPGAVQPHGALVIERGDLVIAAANLELFNLSTADALGTGTERVLGPVLLDALARVATGEPTSAVVPDLGTVDVLARSVPGGRLLELEPPSDVDLTERAAVPTMLRSLQQSGSVDELLERTVEAVRQVTGFERVMAYRFDDEWNGTVVAESVAAGHGTFLGLRYPANDIPPQARALYLRNRVRIIPDVHAAPAPLLSATGDADAVDLSDASLRAVSPVHLEYLRNMGVRASASLALVVDGSLWGLVACHSYTASRRPSQRVRIILDVMAGTASALVNGLSTAARATERVRLLERLDVVTTGLRDETDGDPLASLDAAAVRDLLDADAFLLTSSSRVRATAGPLPPDDDVAVLLDWLTQRDDGTWSTDRLRAEPPPGLTIEDPAGDAAGVLALRWGDAGDWMVAVRREQLRSIRWGGDPTDKEVVLEPDGARLGPRRSFEEYVETVRGTAEPWSEAHRDALAELARRVRDAVARRGRRDRSVAAMMQKALLLHAVPHVPGADVAVTYRPSEGDALGGDWFDVYFRPDGRAVIALGDVAGHGMDVASTMAQIRHALRAYAMSEHRLAAAMARLNELCANLLPRDMATLVVAAYAPEEGTLEVVNAGHLPPVRFSAGTAELAALERNPALGISRDVEFAASEITLGHGDGVVLFTDGLVERRQVPIDERLELLAERVATSTASDSRGLCDELDEAFEPDGSDDVTILVLRRP